MRVKLPPPPNHFLGARHAIEDICQLFSIAVDWTSSPFVTVPWPRSVTWWDVVTKLLDELAKARKLRLTRNGALIENVEFISDRGGAPAWHLKSSNLAEFKLRADLHSDLATRIVQFLRMTTEINWPACARLVGCQGCAVLKTWIIGTPLAEVPDHERSELIRGIGSKLGELHRHAPELCAPLVCSADNFNTLITKAGEVAFVDLEAVTIGLCWIDLEWSEELLCRSDEEVEMLWSGYSTSSYRSRPAPNIRRIARKKFLQWLMVQLEAASRRSPNNALIKADMEAVIDAYDSPPGSRVFRDGASQRS